MQQERSVLHQACWRALVLYLVAGLLWFGAGDAVMPLLVKDQQLYIMLQRAQDYIFVLLSGCYAAWLVACAIRANERREVARQALAQSEEHMRLALEASGIGMWDLDMVSRRHSFSGGMSSMMRYEGDDFARDFDLRSRIHPEDLAMVKAQTRHSLQDGVPFLLTARIKGFDDQYRWFEARGNRHLDTGGRPVRFSGILVDKTKQRTEEERLRLAAAVVDNTAEGIVVTDVHTNIISTNPAFSRLLGYEAWELKGKRPSTFKSGRHDKAFYEAMWASLLSTGQWRGEIWNRRKNGEIFPERMSLNAVKDAKGETTHYVCMFSDISQEKKREEQLQFLAHRDALTGLSNRAWFVQELERCVQAAQREKEQFAVILLNLNRFKDVNDSYGHSIGDEVLRHCARQVQSALTPGDLIARMAGDEIVVLTRGLTSAKDAGVIAERLINAVAQPWKSPDGFAVVASVSAGICCYPQHAQNATSLVQGAHAAVYGAKRGKGTSNQWCFFNKDMTRAARERIALESRLRNALEQGHLQMFYQPQIDIDTGNVVGCEALMRWFDPVEGMISPTRFIPVAETSGLIGPLGEWALEEVCRQAQAWTAQGLPPISMAVNMSLHQFLLTDIVGCTRKALERSGLPAARLELEITESALAARPEEALTVLRSLKELGLRLAIDDFGTGYSSLAHLKQFPIDLLKIDQGFIRDIPDSADDMAISRAVIAMGQNMGLKVLAEGVETAAQLEFLRQHGCNYYQGFFCSKPITGAEFTQLLQGEQRRLEHAKLCSNFEI
ncbi:putative bifunctional diguanylate cyclase/phosphodiesterase [Comamonas sp. NoAH]|uniref:putative bifunctional diguanylate cyclase/phosphodiesterase n=1 Tax=Comamonas halotolerans TaxID=3041496 RepID=UPI0024E11FB1|nr:EAL domain-containing protein [Comamonas sp. NoAH]